MTGTGAYCFIVWGIWLRHCLNKRQDEYRLDWSSWFSFPSIVKADQKAGNAGPRAPSTVKQR